MSHLKIALMTAVLAVAFSNAVWAAADPNFCVHPVDSVTVTFGATDANGSTHNLSPNEVTITEGGTVTFDVVSGGHFISIYPVSLNTDRADIEASLLQPDTTGCVEGPPCTANSQYLVTDGTGHLVLDTGNNPFFNRVNVAAGATAGIPVTSPTTKVTHTFHIPGRYMVNCDNRGHFVPAPYMFGFVNVVRCGSQP